MLLHMPLQYARKCDTIKYTDRLMLRIVRRGDTAVKKRFAHFVTALLLTAVVMTVCMGAAQALNASVVMKVSRTAQDSVINAGEDLTIDVALEGVSPETYRWYFNDAPIAGADQRAYTLFSAKAEDAGLYRVEAFDEAGKMLVSMEFTVRVVEKALPKAGDDTLSIAPVAGVMGLAAAGMATALVRRKRRAA